MDFSSITKVFSNFSMPSRTSLPEANTRNVVVAVALVSILGVATAAKKGYFPTMQSVRNHLPSLEGIRNRFKSEEKPEEQSTLAKAGALAAGIFVVGFTALLGRTS